jgi:hypothetical protein
MVALTKQFSNQFRNKAFSKQVNFCIRKKEKSFAGFSDIPSQKPSNGETDNFVEFLRK